MSKSIFIRNTELATKEDLGGLVSQVQSLPTAGANELGNIYQYKGSDTNQFKNGYFYKCVSKTEPTNCIRTNGGAKVITDLAVGEQQLEIRFKLRAYKNYHNVLFSSESWTSAISLTTSPYVEVGISGSGYSGDYGTNYVDGNTHTATFNRLSDGFNGVDETCVVWTTSNITYPIVLFCDYSNSGTEFDGDIYECTFYDSNNNITHHLIPALGANDAPALYDTVGDTYYYDTNNTMEYVAAGTTYFWVQWGTQPSYYARANDFNIDYSTDTYLKDDNLIEDLTWALNEYLKTTIPPNFWVRQGCLVSIYIDSQEEAWDYKRYGFTFVGFSGTGSMYYYTLYLTTHYNTSEVYGKDSDYPPYRSSKYNYDLVYSYALDNYLSKYNSISYNPSQPYNPSTKKYVDDSILSARTQYTEMPTATTAGQTVQYIGTTDANYRNSSFYKAVSSSLPSKVMHVNDNSCYSLNYTYQSTDYLVMKFMCTVDSPSNIGPLGNTEGSYNYMEIHLDGSTFYVGTGYQETSVGGLYQPNTVYVVEANKNADIIINDIIQHSELTFDSYGTLKLFDYNGNPGFRGDFYYLRVYDKTTGNLKKEWVPDLDQNDTLCIHETVGDTYIYNDYTEYNTYDEVYDNLSWNLVTEYLRPTVVTNNDSTYTIDTLKEHYLYNLGELSSLTISNVDTIYLETNIYFYSGATPTDVSIPDTLVNLGDYPTFTASGNANEGTLDASKYYIISILNNVAIWKAYSDGTV